MKLDLRSMRMIGVAALLLTTGSLFAQTLDQAQHTWDEGMTAKAKNMFVAIAKASPTNALYQYYAGNAYVELGKSDSAWMYFDKGIRSNDADAHNYVGKGRVSLDQGKTDDAKTYFTSAVAKAKKNAEINTLIGIAYLNSPKGDLTIAKTYFDKAMELDSKYAGAYMAMGDLYAKQNSLGNVGQLGNAVTSYENAATYKPNYALPYLKIANIYLASKSYGAAEENLNKIIAFDPDFATAYLKLGETYFLMQKYPDAKTNFEKYISMVGTGTDVDAEKRLASLYYVSKDYDKALAMSNSILAQDPKNYVAKRIKAFTLFETGDEPQAYQVLQDYFKTTVDSNRVTLDYEYMGKILAKEKNDSLAIVNLKQALKMDSSKIELYDLIAGSYLNLKKYPEAAYQIRNKQKNVQYSQTLVDYLNMGKYFYAGEKYHEADTAFNGMIINAKLAKDSVYAKVTGYYWRALSNSAIDSTSEGGLAKPYFDKVVELAVDTEKYKKELKDAYSYLGYYYYIKKDCKQSTDAWKEVLIFDPENKPAKDALDALKNCK